MGKHSGRHALAARLAATSASTLDEAELGKAFKKFKDLADKKKEIYDEDLMAIVKDEMATRARDLHARLPAHHQRHRASSRRPRCGSRRRGRCFQDSGVGDGPVDAVLNAHRRHHRA